MSATATPIDKDYLKLIKRFPLRTIRSDEELDSASELFSELGLKVQRTQGEQDYFEVLGKLIADYEAKSPAILMLLAEGKALSSQEILQSFMTDHSLTQSELARQIDCQQSVLSEFLAGKRGLSKQVALRLANHFKVAADLFLR